MNWKQRQKLKKVLYKKLEDLRGWRIARVTYWLLASLLTWILVASVDDYSYDDDGQRWTNFWGGLVLGFVFYRIMKRLAIYIVYGTLKKSSNDPERRTTTR